MYVCVCVSLSPDHEWLNGKTNPLNVMAPYRSKNHNDPRRRMSHSDAIFTTDNTHVQNIVWRNVAWCDVAWCDVAWHGISIGMTEMMEERNPNVMYTPKTAKNVANLERLGVLGGGKRSS